MGNSILSGLQTKVYNRIYNNKELGSHCVSKKCAGTEAFIDQTQPFKGVVTQIKKCHRKTNKYWVDSSA